MQRVTVYIQKDIYKLLKSLSGKFSEHIRYALEDYADKIRSLKVSASQSKRKGSE